MDPPMHAPPSRSHLLLLRQPVLLGCLVAAFLVGLILRVWIASSSLGALDADEAVVGLMARGIARGELPIFYWGQQYGGAQEAYLTAPGLALAPASVAAVKAVPLLLHSIGVWLCYLIGRRIATPEAGLFAAALFWIWPGYFVWWSLKATGFYGMTIVAGLAGWLCALRIDHEPARRDYFVFGLVAGLGWWASPQIMFLLAPAVIWLTVRGRWGLRSVGYVALAATATALPWLYANLQSGLGSLRAPAIPVVDNTYFHRLQTFFVEALPATIGLRLEDEGGWFFHPLGMVAYAVALGAALVVLGLRSHRLLRIALLSYPLLYAISPFSQGEPRYLYLLAPILVLVVTVAVRTNAMRLLTLLAAVVLSTGSLVAMERYQTSSPFAPDVRVPGGLAQLADDLEAAGVKTVFADYWLAYPITFFSQEEVIATPFRGIVRNQSYEAVVRSAPGSAFVMPSSSVTVALVRSAVTATGAAFEEMRFGGFTLIRSDATIAPESVPRLQDASLDPSIGR